MLTLRDEHGTRQMTLGRRKYAGGFQPMQRFLSFVGCLLFQLVFGAAFIGGAVGTVICVREWRRAAENDFNILPAFAVLTLALAAVGLVGIIRFRDPAVRRLDIETDIAPLRTRKPLGNCVAGALVLLAGIVFAWVNYRSAAAHERGAFEIPVVAICAGIVQLGFGASQLARAAKTRRTTSL
jgi:hypothetical protein